MRVFSFGVFVSLLLALWLEFFYKFGATYDLKNFIGSIPIYSIYIILFHGVCVRLNVRNILKIFLVAGFIGLMAEWFLIGNSPWANPHASQISMFIFHGFYPVAGYVFARHETFSVRRTFLLITLLVFSISSPLGFLISGDDIRFAWFIWIPLVYYYVSSIALLLPQKELAKNLK